MKRYKQPVKSWFNKSAVLDIPCHRGNSSSGKSRMEGPAVANESRKANLLPRRSLVKFKTIEDWMLSWIRPCIRYIGAVIGNACTYNRGIGKCASQKGRMEARHQGKYAIGSTTLPWNHCFYSSQPRLDTRDPERVSRPRLWS